MSPCAALHAQLASIVEALANAAVAEICALVDGGYAALQLEVSRNRKENEALRRKLRLVELRGAAAARATALRAAAASGTTALLPHARGRAGAHHPGNDPRRNRTPAAGDVASSSVSHQETSPVMPAASETTEPTDATTAVIKVEDEDEYEDKSWSQSEQDDGFRCVGDAQTTQTEAPPPPSKQEAADEDGDSSQRRTGEEVSSTSTSVQKTLNGSHQRAESDGYDFLMHEAQLQHGPRSTHNPRREDPGCSYVLNSSLSSVSFDSGSGGSFPADVSEASASEQPAVFTDSQQRAPTARDEPRRPVTGRRDDFIRRDRWRHRRGEDSGGKAFVCNCCGKTLACLKNLKTHMRVHTGEKPFVCTLCGKRFSDSSNLKRHQSVHTGEKRYGCAHCGKRFAQSGSLKVHMSVHTDCKQFRCSFCGRTFISSSHLRRHVAVHAGEKRFAHTLH